MKGADSLIKSLEESGVDICFANPGTSEMHQVSALDHSEKIKTVLVLFEGVASGAADGYARIAEKPAATLLHLGPGLANSMANLHNARRAYSPVINIIGDHSTDHLKYDSPLTSDLKAYANACSHLTICSESADHMGEIGAQAYAASISKRGQIVTVITYADHCWEQTEVTAAKLLPSTDPVAEQSIIQKVARRLKKKGAKAVLLMSGKALYGKGLEAAGKIAASTGARLVAETFAARMERGAGAVACERLPYFPEEIDAFLATTETLLLVGSKSPASFFAYQGKESSRVPEACDVITLAAETDDIVSTLEALVEELSAANAESVRVQRVAIPQMSGKLCPQGVGSVLNNMIPEDAIISDEGNTSGLATFAMTANAPKHEILAVTGGSIGLGLPLAVGAALAAPERKNICLQGDGGAMYTPQALWTMARENLDITVVIFNNASYCILNVEAMRTGIAANATDKLTDMLNIGNPTIDWTALATAQGVSATRAETVEEFADQFQLAINNKGPNLIEAIIEPLDLSALG